MRAQSLSLFLVALLAGSVLPVSAQAASFPCADAKHPDEVAICGHLVLDDADVEMATLYQTLLPLLAMGGAGATRDDQKVWLARRQACDADMSCLTAAYADRIAALKASFARIAAGGPY